jgi:myosin protein heavy chain
VLVQVKRNFEVLEQEVLVLNGNKTRFEKDMADMTLELDREHQLAKSAERMTSKLQAQLVESREQLDCERKAKISAQGQARQLKQALEAANSELKERTDQVIALYRAVNNGAETPVNWAGYKAKIAASVDLARKLQEAVQGQRRAESSRQALEQQLADLKKKHHELNDFDQKHSLGRLQKNVSSLEIPTSPVSRPASAPWTPPTNVQLSPSRTRTNMLARSFDQNLPLQPLQQPVSDDSRKLQSELEALRRKLAAIEAERQQLLKKQSMQEQPNTVALTKLQRENKRLHELLDDNADQLDAIADSQRSDRAFLKDLQTKSMQEIEATFATLADERVAMTQAQKKSLAELHAAKQSMQEVTTSKNELSRAVQELKLEVEQQIALREQEASVSAQLEDELNDLSLKYETEASRSKELEDSIKVFRQRAEEYYSRLEQAEVTVLKASRAESFAKKQWQEAEEALKAAAKDRSLQDSFIAGLQKKLAELDEKLEDHNIELVEASSLRNRLQQEIDGYRNSQSAELQARDASAEQTRKAYGRELATLSAELEAERMGALTLIEDNKTIRGQLEELQAKAAEDSLNAAAFAKDKLRLDNKVADLSEAYEESSTAQREAQNRIVSMLSELRSLRAAKDDADGELKLLANEKKQLEHRLRDLQQSLRDKQVQPQRANHDQEAELIEKEEAIRTMTERVRRADAAVQDAQREMVHARDANVQLHRQKAALENERKELKLKLVDFETRSLTPAASDRSLLLKRIQDLEEEVARQAKAKSDESRTIRSSDRTIKELEAALQRKELAEQLLSKQAAAAESRLHVLQQDIEGLRDSDAAHQLKAKRAEREATDQRERALRAEKELERLRSRDEAAKGMSRQNTLASASLRKSMSSRALLGTQQ